MLDHLKQHRDASDSAAFADYGRADVNTVTLERSNSDRPHDAGPLQAKQRDFAVSVISPFYNRSEYVRPLIATLERQTFKDFELIFVDDGSHEDLWQALKGVRPSFAIHIVTLATNRGAASARNAGIDAARGRYVAFLDSDDSWDPTKLEKQLRHLQTASDGHRLVSLTRQQVVSDRRYVAPNRTIKPSDRVGTYLFQQGGVIQTSTLMLSTALARKVRFVEGGRGHDDWSLALKLEAAGARFEMLDEPLTIYNDEHNRTRRSPKYSAKRLNWLDAWRSELGEKPYLAARAALISRMPDFDRSVAAAMINEAARCGAVPPWRAAYYRAALAFPWLRPLAIRAKQLWLQLRHRNSHPKE